MRFSGWWPNPIQSGPIFWAQSPSGTAERLLGILPGGCPPALGAIKRTVGFKGEAQGYQALGTEFRGWTPGVAPIGSRIRVRNATTTGQLAIPFRQVTSSTPPTGQTQVAATKKPLPFSKFTPSTGHQDGPGSRPLQGPGAAGPVSGGVLHKSSQGSG